MRLRSGIGGVSKSVQTDWFTGGHKAVSGCVGWVLDGWFERVVYPVHPHILPILILTGGLAGFGQVAHIFHHAAYSWLKIYTFASHACSPPRVVILKFKL